MQKLTQEEFIDRCKKKFGSKYDYSKTIYKNKRTNIIITCPIHGYVTVNPYRFLKSNIGCPKCGINYASIHNSGNKETFFKKAKQMFGDNYSFYDDYINNKIPILIHCNVCGNDFKKRPNDFLMSKHGGCQHYNIKDKQKIDFNTFVRKSNEIYDNFFQYRYFDENKDIKETVTIICPIHGEFSSVISKHLSGNGCKWCNLKKSKEELKKESDEFKKKAIKKYGNEFEINYDEYKGSSYKIHMKCNKCGYLFKRTPYEHLYGNRHCSKCSSKQTGLNRIKTTEQYIKECINKYKDEYSYDKTIYIKSDKPVIIKHNKCGRYFSVEANSFLQGHGCPYHLINKSKSEIEIYEYIKILLPDKEIIQNDRKILNGNELDIYIPSMKLAFEYDGLFWHNENNKQNDYHINKTIECEEKGIRLIHIFEDEWLNKKNIWKSLLKNLLLCEKKRIFARNCKINKITFNESKNFLSENDLDGNCKASIRYGLFFNNKLVSVMLFEKMNKYLNNYKLVRFTNLLNTLIIGAASKLFKYFIEEIKPDNVITFVDRRWSQGHLFKILGFELYNTTKPNFYYVINNERINKSNITKSMLIKKYNCPVAMHIKEFCKQKKWYKIYDCGTLCYKWIK